MAIGDEIRQIMAADTTYAGAVQLRQIGAADALALSAVMSNPKRAKPAAISITAAHSIANLSDTAYTTNKVDIGNRPHVMVDVEFTSASGSLTLYLAKYDINGTYMGLSNVAYIQPQGTGRNGAAGKYSAEQAVIDVGNASYVYPYVPVWGDSTQTDIFISVL